MKLLVVNDDGIDAKGIHTLAKELEKYHQVTVVAPHSQRSASGHSITLMRPITIKEKSIEGLKGRAFSITGTPADCVRLGLDLLTEGKIDMVISGINRGPNLGTDVIYSGTVSAAIEAAIYKIPSLAVSQDIKGENENYEAAAKYAVRCLKILGKEPLGEDVVLNLNIPSCSEEQIKGIKVCKLGKTSYKHKYIEIVDKEGKTYTVDGVMNEKKFEEDDVDYLRENYVTLTPLHFDLTNFNILKEVENMITK